MEFKPRKNPPSPSPADAARRAGYRRERQSLVLRVHMVGIERRRAFVPGGRACLAERFASHVEAFQDDGVEHRMKETWPWAGVEFIRFTKPAKLKGRVMA